MVHFLLELQSMEFFLFTRIVYLYYDNSRLIYARHQIQMCIGADPPVHNLRSLE